MLMHDFLYIFIEMDACTIGLFGLLISHAMCRVRTDACDDVRISYNIELHHGNDYLQ